MIYFLVLLLFLSCEKVGVKSDPEWGCMDSSACNYSPDANRDDSSCIFAEIHFDCDGNCISDTDAGCECGDKLDECGQCGGIGPTDMYDCGGNCVAQDTESNELDESGLDCAGTCGGSALLDECGQCSGGYSGNIANVNMDCTGICFGSASLDCAGICNGLSVLDTNGNCCLETEMHECGYCGDLDEYNLPGDWTVIFEDQFTGPEIDTMNWNFEKLPAYAYNNEQQAYTSREENAYIDDGKLVIEARRENYIHTDSNTGDESSAQYTSARLNTKLKADFKPLSCDECGGGAVKVEVKAKLPSGEGTWPAIWMLPTYSVYGQWPASGEIDIMEHAPNTGTGNILSSVHTTLNNHAQNTQVTGSQYIPDSVNEYKIYRLIWTDSSINIDVENVDGSQDWDVLYFEDNGTGPSYYPFDQEFHILLNLAIGGLMGGDVIDNQAFPQRLYIDYVKVSQMGCLND